VPSLGLERVLGGPQDVVGDTSDGTNFGASPSGCASCLQFSPDGSRLATATADCQVQIFDTVDGQRIEHLEGHSEIVTSLAWFHQEQHKGSSAFFSASLDKTVRLWKDYKPKAVLRDHCDWIRCLGLSCDDSTIVSGCVSSNMVAWDVETGQLKFKVSAVRAASFPPARPAKCSTFQHSVNSLQFSNNSANVFASGIRDGSVMLWDTRSLASGPVLGMKAHFGKLNQIQLGRSDHLLLSGGRDGAVRLWDMRMLGKLCSSMNQTVLPHENPALQMEYKSHSCSSYNISSVLLNYDRHVATGSEDCRVWIYDALTGEPVKKLEGHSAVTHFVHTPSEDESGGPMLASSSIDSSIVHLWSPAASMEPVQRYNKVASYWHCCDGPACSQTSVNGSEVEEGSPHTSETEEHSVSNQQEERPGPMLRGVEEFAAQRVRQDCLQRKAVEELMHKHGDVILRIFHHFDYSFRSPFDWQALLAHVRAAQQLHESPRGGDGPSAESAFAQSLAEIANDFQQFLQQFVDRQSPLTVHPVR